MSGYCIEQALVANSDIKLRTPGSNMSALMLPNAVQHGGIFPDVRRAISRWPGLERR